MAQQTKHENMNYLRKTKNNANPPKSKRRKTKKKSDRKRMWWYQKKMRKRMERDIRFDESIDDILN